MIINLGCISRCVWYSYEAESNHKSATTAFGIHGIKGFLPAFGNSAKTAANENAGPREFCWRSCQHQCPGTAGRLKEVGGARNISAEC